MSLEAVRKFLEEIEKYEKSLVPWGRDSEWEICAIFAEKLRRALDEPEPQDEALKTAQAALERDRTKVAECVTAISKALENYDWLREGRGSYEWNDDRWHSEFERATNAVREAMTPMVKIAADWSNCPKDTVAIQAARRNEPEPAQPKESKPEESLPR